MSFTSPQDQDIKDQVRQATDIVELIGGYLQLRRQGRNYVALCPWHDDTRPSLQVNPERQRILRPANRCKTYSQRINRGEAT